MKFRSSPLSPRCVFFYLEVETKETITSEHYSPRLNVVKVNSISGELATSRIAREAGTCTGIVYEYINSFKVQTPSAVSPRITRQSDKQGLIETWNSARIAHSCIVAREELGKKKRKKNGVMLSASSVWLFPTFLEGCNHENSSRSRICRLADEQLIVLSERPVSTEDGSPRRDS